MGISRNLHAEGVRLMGLEFSPYSKEQQLAGHQKKEKDRPKFKPRRPKKQKRKAETYKGRVIPKAKVRGEISKKEYNRAIEAFGECCVMCGDPRIEMHHVKYRSQQGRGGYRNLMPLCNDHHSDAHTNRKFADMLREQRAQQFGEWYWADKFDLFKAGLIPNTTEKAFETYMDEQERMKRDQTRC
ncbi:hypothetical protein SD77_2011 [Bacillus badius]|uniref:HNH nuclease domain-containing protein n=2 Tax=Bacillus badius TaxID=1455 RepID=A0ABR5AXU9_BACBA|nr:hypothetical protein SD77_2011 [Bacillus badius]